MQSLTSLDRGGFFFYFNTQYHDARQPGQFVWDPTAATADGVSGFGARYLFSAYTKLQFSVAKSKPAASHTRRREQSDCQPRGILCGVSSSCERVRPELERGLTGSRSAANVRRLCKTF